MRVFIGRSGDFIANADGRSPIILYDICDRRYLTGDGNHERAPDDVWGPLPQEKRGEYYLIDVYRRVET